MNDGVIQYLESEIKQAIENKNKGVMFEGVNVGGIKQCNQLLDNHISFCQILIILIQKQEILLINDYDETKCKKLRERLQEIECKTADIMRSKDEEIQALKKQLEIMQIKLDVVNMFFGK